jgi:hypothetical protein
MENVADLHVLSRNRANFSLTDGGLYNRCDARSLLRHARGEGEVNGGAPVQQAGQRNSGSKLRQSSRPEPPRSSSRYPETDSGN